MNAQVLTSERRRGLKALLLMAVGLISLWLVVSAVQRKQGLPIHTLAIEVEPLDGGELMITEADVRAHLKQLLGFELEGKPLSYIDMDRLERGLERVPFVKNAEAWVDAANALHVEVQQRKPLLRIIDAQGVSYYLDLQGVKMPLSPNYSARVPVATGFIPPFVPDFLERPGNTLGYLFRLVQAVQDDELLRPLASQLYVRNGGSVVLVPALGDFEIWLGDGSRLEDELKRLRIFYQYVLAYKGWRKYRKIDLRFAGQIVCKKR